MYARLTRYGLCDLFDEDSYVRALSHVLDYSHVSLERNSPELPLQVEYGKLIRYHRHPAITNRRTESPNRLELPRR